MSEITRWFLEYNWVFSLDFYKPLLACLVRGGKSHILRRVKAPRRVFTPTSNCVVGLSSPCLVALTASALSYSQLLRRDSERSLLDSPYSPAKLEHFASELLLPS